MWRKLQKAPLLGGRQACVCWCGVWGGVSQELCRGKCAIRSNPVFPEFHSGHLLPLLPLGTRGSQAIPLWRSDPQTGLILGNALVCLWPLFICLFIASLFCEITAFEVMPPSLIK